MVIRKLLINILVLMRRKWGVQKIGLIYFVLFETIQKHKHLP